MSESDSKERPSGPEEIALPAPKIAEDELLETQRIGQLIDDRYRVLGVIGRGGMGTVYKAEHVAIRRVVAVKLLHASLARVPEVSRRFEREAFAIGRIEHPNCVNVSDFGRLPDGSLYLVMEYLEGRALSDELTARGRIPPARTLHIVKHVLRGLGHAHANEIVHRDVKPENVILIEYDGDPDFAKILDFGIAKLVGSAAQAGGSDKLTQAGMAFGTPIYMSPEQALGQQIDGRADLYAASVMAFEMITGLPPFQSEDKIEVMSMHASRPLPTMAEVAPGLEVPPVVEQLLQRGLAKRAAERFPNAAAYIAAIDAVLSEIAPGLRAQTPVPTMATGSAAFPGEVILTPMPMTPPPHQSAATPLPHELAALTGSRPESAPQLRASTPLPSLVRASTPLPPPGGPGLPPPGGSGLLSPGSTSTPLPRLIMDVPAPTTLRAKKPWRMAVIAGAALLGVGLVIALVARGPDGDATDEGAAVPGDGGSAITTGTEEGSVAERAAALLAKGSPKPAVELLRANAESIATDAQAQLQLGHAHAALRNNTAALAAYRKALELEARLEADTKLRTNLRLMIDDQGSVVSVDAAALMYEQLGDQQVADRIVSWASEAQVPQVRHRAVEVAEALAMGDRIDWARSLILDLLQEKSCDARRKVVARLRALGDPRAIPELRKAALRRRNNCLEQDAKEAVQYLESLARDGGTPPKG
jgi:serine/threonine protein kinase